MKAWKQSAYALFFDEHKTIIDIAEAVGKTRQTVSAYLTDCPGFDKEIEFRRTRNAENRRYKKMIFMRDSRTEAAVLKREHEQAVKELSAERYH